MKYFILFLAATSTLLSSAQPTISFTFDDGSLSDGVKKETNKWRPLVVFCFGLLHGLGFAAVLSEYGLPKGNLMASLLAFNIGVELGQLTLLFAAAAVVWGIWDKIWYRQRVQVQASILIALVGLFWFVERVFL